MNLLLTSLMECCGGNDNRIDELASKTEGKRQKAKLEVPMMLSKRLFCHSVRQKEQSEERLWKDPRSKGSPDWTTRIQCMRGLRGGHARVLKSLPILDCDRRQCLWKSSHKDKTVSLSQPFTQGNRRQYLKKTFRRHQTHWCLMSWAIHAPETSWAYGTLFLCVLAAPTTRGCSSRIQRVWGQPPKRHPRKYQPQARRLGVSKLRLLVLLTSSHLWEEKRWTLQWAHH